MGKMSFWDKPLVAGKITGENVTAREKWLGVSDRSGRRTAVKCSACVLLKCLLYRCAESDPCMGRCIFNALSYYQQDH